MTTDYVCEFIVNPILKEDRLPDPHGYIQLKGTDICVDIHCSCGHLSHYDGDFLYAVRCPQCKQNYLLGSHIRLYPITPEQESLLEKHWIGAKEAE